MSSRSEAFECHWQPSLGLLLAYAAVQGLASLSLLLLDLPVWGVLLGLLGCLGHALWVMPRQVLLTSPAAYRGLRHDQDGWQLFSEGGGWQAVQLCPDSLALPLIVVLRFRLAGQRRVRALCIPRDSLPRDLHRRLRLRLKFSRRRWAAAE